MLWLGRGHLGLARCSTCSVLAQHLQVELDLKLARSVKVCRGLTITSSAFDFGGTPCRAGFGWLDITSCLILVVCWFTWSAQSLVRERLGRFELVECKAGWLSNFSWLDLMGSRLSLPTCEVGSFWKLELAKFLFWLYLWCQFELAFQFLFAP